MIPYPSMRSLIEGQNIKYSDQILIEKKDLLQIMIFYLLVQKTALLKANLGIQPKDRVIIRGIDPLLKKLLLFWNLANWIYCCYSW